MTYISYFDTKSVYIQMNSSEHCSSLPHVSEQVGRVYPQAVYFPIRTLYLTLKIEQRERYKSGMSWGAAGQAAEGMFHGAIPIQSAVDS